MRGGVCVTEKLRSPDEVGVYFSTAAAARPSHSARGMGRCAELLHRGTLHKSQLLASRRPRPVRVCGSAVWPGGRWAQSALPMCLQCLKRSDGGEASMYQRHRGLHLPTSASAPPGQRCLPTEPRVFVCSHSQDDSTSVLFNLIHCPDIRSFYKGSATKRVGAGGGAVSRGGAGQAVSALRPAAQNSRISSSSRQRTQAKKCMERAS